MTSDENIKTKGLAADETLITKDVKQKKKVPFTLLISLEESEVDMDAETGTITLTGHKANTTQASNSNKSERALSQVTFKPATILDA
eukprot:CAMPEP_0114350792 /NCGR_PEP_ID=MMETSP0101-20121206/16650_1 /TAXON_ID=38822 ORGANISM="Pteridomonas danica, Strain PT" /NCGR_SAMPLE_ID=MMETSP0101 /ASSEMBLY_ACC=CAM_ASM_000211 /LENGTH=86 /DNA_ID=CAMNT_0001490247 /DNA_START=562 /DNA_END=819 /DNA_ORIENTATION=-